MKRDYKGYTIITHGSRVLVYDSYGLLATFPDMDKAKEFVDALFERECGGVA